MSGGGFWLNTFIKTQAEFGDPVSRIMKRDGWVLTNANAMLLALPPISILKVDNSARRDPNPSPSESVISGEPEYGLPCIERSLVSLIAIIIFCTH